MARGSITPRPTKDGKVRYRVKWESRGPNGQRRHHSATATTKKAAEILLNEKLSDVDDGTFLVASKETVGQFLERWLEASAPKWSESTQHAHSLVVRTRIKPRIGTVPLA